MNRLTVCVALALALGTGMGASIAHADGFTYHGSLQDAGEPANGRYDLQLTLYSAQDGGHVLAGPVTLYGVDVKDGNFSTSVDFGPMSLATQGWVGVAVKSAGGGSFVALDARSPVAPDGGCPGSWALDGNAGNPSGSYLGTSDATDLVVKSNGGTVAIFGTNGSSRLSFPYAAVGAYSTAIGYNAGTNFEGSIVTGGRNDATFGTNIRDTGPNQVILVAQNGVGINTSHAPDNNALRDELTIAPSAHLPGANADLTFETSTTATGYNGFNFSAIPGGYFQLNGLHDDNNVLTYHSLMYINYSTAFGGYGVFQFNGANGPGVFNVGHNAQTGNGAYLTAGGVWTNASSRSFKEAFQKVDTVDVLGKLVALPVQTWFYKGSHGEGRHMGPVAEEFAAAFGLGNDETHITTVDESGIAFAAIQGLNKKVERENEVLRRENADLRGSLERIVARIERLEGRKGD